MRLRKSCGTCARDSPDRPTKFMRTTCWGTHKYAEIVRNLCESAPAQFSQNLEGGGLPDVRTQVLLNFRYICAFFSLKFDKLHAKDVSTLD